MILWNSLLLLFKYYDEIWLIFAGYLTGSIPWGLLLTRMFSDSDIYREGSGNIGATNVRRVAGRALGGVTLIGDVLKGCLPLLLAAAVTNGDPIPEQWLLCLVAIAAVAGHMFPVYLKGRGGGKGVATVAGCFLVLAPEALAIAVVVFLAGCWWFNRVSAASLSAAAVLPLAVWLTGHSGILVVCATLLAIAVAGRHRDNIQRLRAGRESLIRKKN